jgi:hypothetical protein
VPHFLSPAQKIARVEASKTILRVLWDTESNDFEGIATGDGSWFRHCYPSLTMFARAPSEAILRTRQKIGAKNTMITIFFTARQLILLYRVSHIGCNTARHEKDCVACPRCEQDKATLRRLAAIKTR